MDENIEIFDIQKYEQAVSECKILRTFIKTVVCRKITVFSKNYMIMFRLNMEKLLMLLKL